MDAQKRIAGLLLTRRDMVYEKGKDKSFNHASKSRHQMRTGVRDKETTQPVEGLERGEGLRRKLQAALGLA